MALPKFSIFCGHHSPKYGYLVLATFGRPVFNELIATPGLQIGLGLWAIILHADTFLIIKQIGLLEIRNGQTIQEDASPEPCAS